MARSCAVVVLAVTLAASLTPALAQPFQPGNGLVPLGNLRTSDRDGKSSPPAVSGACTHTQALCQCLAHAINMLVFLRVHMLLSF